MAYEVQYSNGVICALRDGEAVAAMRFGRYPEGNPAGVLIITDLEGTGDGGAIRAMLKELTFRHSPEPIYIGVRYDNPKFEKLLSFYNRQVNAEPEMLIMRIKEKNT